MKRVIMDFFASGRTTTQEDLAKALRTHGPVLRSLRRENEREHTMLRSWNPAVKWSSFSMAAVLCAVILYSARPHLENQDVVGTVVQSLPASPTPLLIVRPSEVIAHVHQRSSGTRERTDGEQSFRRDAVEFLRELDLLLVLPILRDLEVLRRWSGTTTAQSPFPTFWPIKLVTFCWADELPISDDFLEQILKVFPTIPRRQQAEIIAALERLKPIWQEKRQELLKNYRTYRDSPPEARRRLEENFQIWNSLSEEARFEITAKYQRWIKLSSSQQAKIRKSVLSRNRDEQG